MLTRGLPLGLACATILLAAQTAPPHVPTFRASTQLVQINVIVDGKSGPVTDLAANDFVLTDNGKPQPIRIFSLDDAAAAPAATTAPDAASASGAYTNSRERSRAMVVVLLDGLSTPDGTEYYSGQPTWRSDLSFRFAKQRAMLFLQQVNPDARVALYALDQKLTVLSDFTADRAQLLAAARGYEPAQGAADGDDGSGAGTGVPGDFDQRNGSANASYGGSLASRNAQLTMAALRAIANHLSGLPGRISLVWITSQPPLSGAAVEAALGRDNLPVYTVDARGLQTMVAREPVSMAEGPDMGLSVKAAIARLNLQPAGLAQLRDIAEQTGGRAFLNTNDIAGAIASAAADSAFSYTLGFYVNAAALDGRYHQLRVTVRRPGTNGMSARYPHGYWALAEVASSSAARRRAAMDAAIRSPLDSTAVALHASVTRDAAGRLRLSGTVDLGSFRLESSGGKWSGAFDFAVITQNATGEVVQRYATTVRIALTEAQYQRALQTGFRFEQEVEPNPGAVTLRILAEDPDSGAVGSLIVSMGSVR